MNIKQTLSSASYTQLVRSFAKENFNLKILSGACLALLFLSLIVVAFLLKQGPTVVALDASGEVANVETKVTDVQIKAAVKQYVQRRYSWSYKNIEDRLRKAKLYVDPSMALSFRKSMVETIKYVQEKKVTQRMYPRDDETEIDLKNKTVTLVMDRITEFDSLKAATETKLKVWFDTGDRNFVNPWGVYVTKEQETGGSR